MPTAAFAHLGCKVNQYEIEKLAESFAARGFSIASFDEPADIYVINTCSVTSAADRKSRQLARRAARQKDGARVVLTGCFAQLALDEQIDVDGAALLVSNKDKMKAAELALQAFPDLDISGEIKNAPTAARGAIHVFPDNDGLLQLKMPDLLPQSLHRTRATLKVQDGCQHFCAFCSIPYTRNVMASRSLSDTVLETKQLAGRGVKEIVVTGVCVGAYKDNESDLASLISAVADVSGIERVRLSSIQPIEVNEPLIASMNTHPNVCRHLHLSLQSGSDSVLKSMQRPYNARFYREKVEQLRAAMPEIALTTDIIVGFPGETDEQFEETLRFAQEMAFSRIHVFRYSPRHRTFAAENYKDDISSEAKETRHKRLSGVALSMRRDFVERHCEQPVSVLAETRISKTGEWSGYTDSYIRVRFKGEPGIAGSMVDVQIQGASDDGEAYGALIGQV